MYNTQQIKQLLTPIMVAQHYLGQGKIKGNRIWYKSPFRNERTASLMVDNISFHDFGDGWHGDIISFIERYYNTDFTNAIKILSMDFGIPEDEPMSKEVEQYTKQKRQEEQLIRKNLDNWFNSTYIKICDNLHFWKKAIPYLKQDALEIGYNTESKLNILWEIFFDAVNDEKKKIELWKNREEIYKCF